MKISKEKIHSELRPLPFIIKLYTFLLTKRFGFRLMGVMFKKLEGKITEGMVNEKLSIKSTHGGSDIRLRIYKPKGNSDRLPVMLYLHGGGYALGNPEQAADILKVLIKKRPCVDSRSRI